MSTHTDGKPKHKHNCMPCRKRKSKCDRVQPCSPCVLRDTVHLCYVDQDASSSRSTLAPNEASPTAKRARLDPEASQNDDTSGADSAANKTSSLIASLNILSETRQRLIQVEDSIKQFETAVEFTNVIQTSTITWQTLSPYVPSEFDCQLLLDVFFVELDWHISFVQRPKFFKEIWNKLHDKGDSVTLSEAALVCSMIALALLLLPQSHAAARITSMTTERRDSIAKHAAELLSIQDRIDTHLQPARPNLTRLQAEMTLCHYLMNAGHFEASYRLVGSAIRCGKVIGLFDERSRDWRTRTAPQPGALPDFEPAGPTQQRRDPVTPNDAPSALEKELRRRVAWELIVLDRWQSLQLSRPPDLSHQDVYLALPEYYADEHFDPETGEFIARPSVAFDRFLSAAEDTPTTMSSNTFSAFHASPTSFPRRLRSGKAIINKLTLTELVPSVQMFLSSFMSQPPAWRYAQARSIDERFAQWARGSNSSLEDARQSLISGMPSAYRTAAQALINHSACRFLRCILNKCFLNDEQAPADLRTRALEHAKSIMETIPLLINLSSCAYISFNPSWCAEHLFHAATSFAFVLLTQPDDDLESSFPSSHQQRPSSNSAARERGQFPLNGNPIDSFAKGSSELNWFATNIFDILDTLSLLGMRNGSARVCVNVLMGLCDSRKDMRQRFDLRRMKTSNTLANHVFWQPPMQQRRQQEEREQQQHQHDHLSHHRHSQQQQHPPQHYHQHHQQQVRTNHSDLGLDSVLPNSTLPNLSVGPAGGLVSSSANHNYAMETNRTTDSSSSLRDLGLISSSDPLTTLADLAPLVRPGLEQPGPPTEADLSAVALADIDSFAWLFMDEFDWAELAQNL